MIIDIHLNQFIHAIREDLDQIRFINIGNGGSAFPPPVKITSYSDFSPFCEALFFYIIGILPHLSGPYFQEILCKNPACSKLIKHVSLLRIGVLILFVILLRARYSSTLLSLSHFGAKINGPPQSNLVFVTFLFFSKASK